MARLKSNSKYRAVRTSCGKHEHASKREARRCGELQLLLKAGKIMELVQQPHFRIDLNGKHICDYVADFRYVEPPKLIEVIEDCKGMRTPLYRLKKKLVEALYGVEIRET